MRLLDQTGDSALKSIIVYLTRAEAEELRDSVNDLLEHSNYAAHHHIYCKDFKRELTICIYNEDDLAGFDERSKRLIANDE